MHVRNYPNNTDYVIIIIMCLIKGKSGPIETKDPNIYWLLIDLTKMSLNSVMVNDIISIINYRFETRILKQKVEDEQLENGEWI